MSSLDPLMLDQPRRIDSTNLPDPHRVHDRVVAISIAFVNIIGVNDGSIDWCPNQEPPDRNESLAWLWLRRPDLSVQISEQTDNRHFAEQIAEYLANERAG